VFSSKLSKGRKKRFVKYITAVKYDKIWTRIETTINISVREIQQIETDTGDLLKMANFNKP